MDSVMMFPKAILVEYRGREMVDAMVLSHC
jgi:hypothetical protein